MCHNLNSIRTIHKSSMLKIIIIFLEFGHNQDEKHQLINILSPGVEMYDNELGDIRTIILDRDGASVLRRVVRSHRDDKHIQHTVCLILSLLLEFTYRGLDYTQS